MFVKNYNTQTSQNIKLLDGYLLFIVLSGILQFVYMLLAGSYPYNAFLAGFCACVGTFVLTGAFCKLIVSQSTFASGSLFSQGKQHES